MQNIVIEKVEKDTALHAALTAFVEASSWDEVKDHTSRLLREWAFIEWETPFAAVADGQIVGMATLMQTDYYPLPELCPWISTLFVTEAFRRQGICGELIAAAERYAKSLGFEKSYIPTSIVGLYERYGYVYVKDIVNYGGETDRLYAKSL